MIVDRLCSGTRVDGLFPKLQSLTLVNEDHILVRKGNVELVDLTDEGLLDKYCRRWNRIAKMYRKKTALPPLIFKSMVSRSSAAMH